MPNNRGVAYTAPPSIPNADRTDEERIRSIEDYLGVRLRARVRKTVNQNMTYNTPTTIDWDVADYDTAHLWDQSGRFVIPRGGEGDYLINAKIQVFGPAGGGTGIAFLYMDNAAGPFLLDYMHADFPGDRAILLGDESLRPGDSLYVQYRNDSGLYTPWVNGGTAVYRSTFSIRRLI